MSSTARDRRRAIAFVVASVVILLVSLGILGGVRLSRKERAFFVAVPDSVSGLRAASSVEYKGVPVGVVKEIAFRNGSVEAVQVELAIREGVPVKVDTRARLRPQGITGLNLLELTGGTANARDLPEGGVIPIEPSIMAELEATVRDVAAIAKRLNATTAAIESDATAAVRELREALVAGRDAARALEAGTAMIGSEALASAAAFRATSDDLRGILSDPAWKRMGGEMLGALEDARRAIARLEGAATEAERLAGDNRADVRAAVENLRRASGDVRSTARRVRESPSSLVRDRPPVEKAIPDPLPSVDEGKDR